MARKKPPQEERSPEQRPITEHQASYLAKLAGLSPRELTRKPIGEVNELLKWKLDPPLLLFRRICGRVVKENPATGQIEGVPNATVHVEDTDCSFLAFSPPAGPYFWLFPFLCRREVIATVTTDACGNFCVYIPAWDVDRILRFRRKRICLPEIFKPSILDILKHPIFEVPPINPPRPQPDPPPLRFDPGQIEKAAAILGPEVADQLEHAADLRQIGDAEPHLEALLQRPAFLHPTPPPLPPEMRARAREFRRTRKPSDLKLTSERIPLAPDQIKQVDFNRYLGPFLRCRDVLIPTWVTFLDVPDITFRVTQDVDMDGSEETIYSEGFFDVRWNETGPLNVTLAASGDAISVAHCEPVDEIDCADKPAIVTAGYMPLEATHHDNAEGVGTRVNRPRPPDGRYSTPQSMPSHAPYAASLNLHGCHRLGGATHYRLTYRYRAEDAAALSAPVPFTGIKWWAPRLGPGAPIHMVPDSGGWYPIHPAADLAHPNWLLWWPTHSFPNGFYEVRLELGQPAGGSMSIVDTSDPESFLVDNSRPALGFVEIRWRPASIPLATPWTDANSNLLPVVCPVLTRPSGLDVHLQVAWSASAPHLRNAHLSASGCGAGGLSFVTGEDSFRHWYEDETDNTINETAILLLPGNRPAGCYHLRIDGWGRQFNPSGFDHGPGSNWLINQGTFGHAAISRSISLVNT